MRLLPVVPRMGCHARELPPDAVRECHGQVAVLEYFKICADGSWMQRGSIPIHSNQVCVQAARRLCMVLFVRMRALKTCKDSTPR